MINLKTYIINLKTSIGRKEYMTKLLSNYNFTSVEFVEAVDGRVMDPQQRLSLFDVTESYKRYGRYLNGGEIGCTLSHFKCYETLINSNELAVLILEDDISIMRVLSQYDADMVTKFMSSNEEPRILFLSGDYWYWNKKPIARVFAAVGSYAYIINRAAAKLIIKNINRPSNVADDWRVYRTLGIKLYATYPYVVDANIVDIPSEIDQEYWGFHRNKMTWIYFVRSCIVGIFKKILVKIGHFESKQR